MHIKYVETRSTVHRARTHTIWLYAMTLHFVRFLTCQQNSPVLERTKKKTHCWVN